MKILIFSKNFRPKQKIVFRKISKIHKIRKNRKIENLKICEFLRFFEKRFFVLVDFFSKKNQNFQKQILFFVLFLLCPRGVLFSSPRTGSKSVCGAPPKKLDFFRANHDFGGVSFVILLCSTPGRSWEGTFLRGPAETSQNTVRTREKNNNSY